MRHQKHPRAVAFGAALGLALLAAACDQPADTPVAAGAPALAAAPQAGGAHRRTATDTVTGTRLIVRFHDGADAERLSRELSAAHGARTLHVYNHVFRGFNLVVPHAAADRVAQALSRNPSVKYVVPDRKVELATPQYGVGWGLDRIDQMVSVAQGNGTFNYFQTGAGVNIYVVDSGIAAWHPEFQGRFGGLSFTSAHPYDPYQDCRGHGTNVASVAAGAQVGVAKGATLHPLQVFGCTGNASDGDIASAVDWVVAHGPRPAVINLSLGSQTRWYSGIYNPLEDAVRGAVSRGVHVVIAAGNDGINACDYTPARVGEGITVGASNQYDQRVNEPGWWASNFGSCVDVFAPGLWVDRALHTGGYDSGGNGTSLATPYVTGTVALVLQERPGMTPAAMQDVIKQTATAGLQSSTLGAGSPNKLLYSPHTIVTISGVNALCRTGSYYSSGTYTWSLSILGGGDTREFDWYIGYNDGNEEIYDGPTNAPDYTQYIDTSIGNFEVVGYVQTYGMSYTRKMPVTILEC